MKKHKALEHREYFLHRSSCNFVVVSNTVSPEEITLELGISPTRTLKKGEKGVGKRANSAIISPHNIWEIWSGDIINEEFEAASHIEYLKEKLKNSLAAISRYRENSEVELIVSVWIESELSGTGFSLTTEEMTFINAVSDRFDCYLFAREEIIVE